MMASIVWDEDLRQIPALESPEDAHVWCITPSAHFSECLGPRERARMLAMRSAKTQAEYAAAQGGLRHVLSRYLGCAPGEVPLRRREGGKPYLESGPAFNLSHTAGVVIAVVSRQEVGVDVEKADREVSVDGIARKFFTAEENDMLRALPEPQRRETFLRLWVCKEAMVKLSGEGIAHGLRKVGVSMVPDRPPRGAYGGRQVHLWGLEPVPGFLGAVATWTPCQPNCFYRL